MKTREDMYVFPEAFVEGIHPHFFVHENIISLLSDCFSQNWRITLVLYFVLLIFTNDSSQCFAESLEIVYFW